MDHLMMEETANLPPPSAHHQHLSQKLGKPTEMGMKTPIRTGLGMIVNKSKTPGSKSIQSLASAQKAVIPSSIGFEIFNDESSEEEKIEKPSGPPASPIDIANRCESFDSLGDQIVEDALQWKAGDVKLVDELRDVIVPDAGDSAEAEALEALGIEEWDEYPAVEIASRIAPNDWNRPISPKMFDELVFDYPMLHEESVEEIGRAEMAEIVEKLLAEAEDEIYAD